MFVWRFHFKQRMSLYREIRMRVRDTLIPSIISGMKNLELKEMRLHWEMFDDLQYAIWMFPDSEQLKCAIDDGTVKLPNDCRFIVKNDGSLYIRAYNRNEGAMMVNKEYIEFKVMDKESILIEQKISSEAINGIVSMFIKACKQLKDESTGLKRFLDEIEEVSYNPCRKVLVEKIAIK
jgi:hypothetical protein